MLNKIFRTNDCSISWLNISLKIGVVVMVTCLINLLTT